MIKLCHEKDTQFTLSEILTWCLIAFFDKQTIQHESIIQFKPVLPEITVFKQPNKQYLLLSFYNILILVQKRSLFITIYKKMSMHVLRKLSYSCLIKVLLPIQPGLQSEG